MTLLNSSSHSGAPAAPGNIADPPPRYSQTDTDVVRPGASTVSVVIPTLNEARNIGWVLGRIPADVSEIILVDGRSTDGTVEAACEAFPDIVVVEERRPGKGAALRAGFARANGDLVVMIDADGSMDPREIPRYIALLETGYDFVKGSRFTVGAGSTDITPIRRLGNRVLVAMVNVLYRVKFTDLCYGYAAFHRRHLPRLALSADGFEIETELITHATRAGLRIAEVPTLEVERMTGKSKLNAFRDGRCVLRTLLATRMWFKPQYTADVLPLHGGLRGGRPASI